MAEKQLKQPLQPYGENGWLRWSHPRLKGLSFIGYSIAADKTAFWIPELKWFLDAGGMQSIQHRPSSVFVTHCHSDHTYNLPNLVSSRHLTDIYAPAPVVPFIERFIAASQQLNALNEDSTGFPYATYTLHGVDHDAGADMGKPIPVGKRHVVRAVKCFHGVPCVGYAFSEVKQRLLPSYQGMPGTEIGRLRKEGVAVTEEVHEPQFVFLGDTNADVFAHTPAILEFPVVFVECTILEAADLPPEEAHARGHMHLLALLPVVAVHPQCTFVLMHFSARYSRADLERSVAAASAAAGLELANVIIWRYGGDLARGAAAPEGAAARGGAAVPGRGASGRGASCCCCGVVAGAESAGRGAFVTAAPATAAAASSGEDGAGGDSGKNAEKKGEEEGREEGEEGGGGPVSSQEKNEGGGGGVGGGKNAEKKAKKKLEKKSSPCDAHGEGEEEQGGLTWHPFSSRTT